MLLFNNNKRLTPEKHFLPPSKGPIPILCNSWGLGRSIPLRLLSHTVSARGMVINRRNLPHVFGAYFPGRRRRKAGIMTCALFNKAEKNGGKMDANAHVAATIFSVAAPFFGAWVFIFSPPAELQFTHPGDWRVKYGESLPPRRRPTTAL